MKTLEEAIAHCKEKAEKLRNKAKQWEICGFDKSGEKRDECIKCADEHEQLAVWLEELKNLRTQKRPQGEWIPVSEKLPKYNKTVLISVKQIGKEARVFTAQRRKRFKTPDIFECCTDNDGWWDFRISAWDDHEVLAWMPLPEPYKEGDKE